tara:strand:- start:110 stop:784 length:675 start_codon:yes stop_codon:yes gene_type:complete
MNVSLSYSATFILGLIHALEPGHGKTFIMAFSIQKSNIKTFVSLLASLFITHFLMLGCVAYMLQFATSSESVKHIIDQFKWLTPLLVISFGFYLLIKHLRSIRKKQAHCCAHHHGDTNVKNATLTGILAGLLPCPTAIAPLLISGLDGEFNSAIWHILVYVIGMTIALLAFVLLVLVLKMLFHKQLDSFTGKINVNLISAVLIICIGIYYLIQISQGGDFDHHH